MRLVTVAHGTRHPSGNEVAAEITALAAGALGLESVASYIELCEPSFASVLASSSQPAVVVPLLLSTGHHLRHDLPAAVASGSGRVVLGPALGPHPLLATAQVARLRAAGAEDGRPVVMVAAGSQDPLAMPDLAMAVHHLGSTWSGPVTLATLSGPGPRPEDVVTPDHAVSPYLLAEGHFARRAREESAASTCVADVVGAHPCVVALVVRRAREAVRRISPVAVA